MEYLLSPSALRVLESFSIVDTLYAFDLDGTLAPIVDDPALVKIPDETCDLLKRLSKFAPLAIISGRSVADLKKILPFEPQFLIGNHGIEGLQSPAELVRMQNCCQNWKKIIGEALENLTDHEGIFLEDKTYSLSIHYRNTMEPAISRMWVSGLIGNLPNNPRIIPGKMVYNIIPEGGFHKGEALQRILEKLSYKFSFFIGDDDTDEDVFTTSNSVMFSVRVGENALSHAKYFLQRQDEVKSLIREIVRFYESR